MTVFKYNKIFIACIFVGLLAALAIGWQRHQLETANSSVEMVMDYDDIVELSQVEGAPLAGLLQRFKDAGLTSLAVYDATLEKLSNTGQVAVLNGGQLLGQYHASGLISPELRVLAEENRIQPDSVYILVNNQQILDDLKTDLILRLSPERVTLFANGGKPVLAVSANYEKLYKMNLGLLSEEMRKVNQAGFYVVARPTNYIQVNEEQIRTVFERFKGVKVTSVIFAAKEALGYPNLLPVTTALLTEQQLTLGMIEDPSQLQFVQQAGLLDLAAAVHYQCARVYAIPKDEQIKMIPNDSDTIHRWDLSDRERDIRINLLRKFDKPVPGQSLIQTNLDYVANVKNELVEKGFSIGRAGVFPAYSPAPFLLSLVMLGVAAAGVLMLTLIWPFAPRYQYILLAVVALLFIVPVLKGGGTLVRQMAATGSAVIFPVLALTWQLDRWRNREQSPQTGLGKILLECSLALITVVGLSLIGGFYLGASLGDVRFFLEIEIFRGVKLAIVAPLILMAIVYLTRYSLFDDLEAIHASNIGKHIARVLDYPIKLKSILLLGLAGLAVLIYVGRSGHTAGIPVPAFEIKLRRLMEAAMYARPREKEIFIGHPAFFLAVLAMYRQWPRILHLVLLIGSVIGTVSLVEAFAHMRTPIFMSAVRAVTGLEFGIVFGIFAVLAVELLRFLFIVWGKESGGA